MKFERPTPLLIRLRSVWDRSGPEDLEAEDLEAAKRTVAYLARYANRAGISNSRLVAIEGDQALFSYKDCSTAEEICVYE